MRVYVRRARRSYVYHSEPDCQHIENVDNFDLVDEATVEDDHRLCETCRYAWVPL